MVRPAGSLLPMKLFLLRLLFAAWFVTRGYYLWSRVMRFFMDWKHRKKNVALYTDIELLSAALGRMQWVEDPWGGAFDVIRSAQRTEAILMAADLLGKRAEVGDCDEFAQYAAVCIQKMYDRGVGDVSQPYFMTVNWLDTEGKFHGHNLCAYHDDLIEVWSYISNWNRGAPYIGFVDLQDIADDIVGLGTIVGWAAIGPGLKGPADLQVGDDPPTS